MLWLPTTAPAFMMTCFGAQHGCGISLVCYCLFADQLLSSHCQTAAKLLSCCCLAVLRRRCPTCLENLSLDSCQFWQAGHSGRGVWYLMLHLLAGIQLCRATFDCAHVQNGLILMTHGTLYSRHKVAFDHWLCRNVDLPMPCQSCRQALA